MQDEFLTLQEIATKLKVSKTSARRLFAREPGILAINASGKRSTPNGRVSLRVPVSVFDRVLNEMRRVD